MTAAYDKDSILATALQIVKTEHEFFVKDGSDNAEHIQRIVRTAESAGTLLSLEGLPRDETRAYVNRIIEFGRRLFIQEWMQPIAGDPEPPREQDAIQEFDRYVKQERTAKKQRSRELE